MTQPSYVAKRILRKISSQDDLEAIKSRLVPRMPEEEPLPDRIPAGNDFSPAGLEKRRNFLKKQGIKLDALTNDNDCAPPESLKGNIENLIGHANIPVGVAGPLRVNGLYASGDFYVPMATTEGALVASYHRGAYLISQCGGATVMCLEEVVMRSPCFVFSSMIDAARFTTWVLEQADSLQEVVAATTAHGKLLDIDTAMNGKNVYLTFKYYTGDASGQNMVTVATEAVCRSLLERSPVIPDEWFLEGNLSGDKKVTMQSFINTRGKKVIAETVIAGKLIERILHTTAKNMELYCKLSTHGGILSGSVGVQGHFANALAAIFIACGQDAACISEASAGLTDMQVTDNGGLYVSVSVPNLIVGTVGGGTHLPTARGCLEMLDCYGSGKAAKFSEICAATILAGEISIIGALAAGEFGAAHAKYRHKA